MSKKPAKGLEEKEGSKEVFDKLADGVRERVADGDLSDDEPRNRHGDRLILTSQLRPEISDQYG